MLILQRNIIKVFCFIIKNNHQFKAKFLNPIKIDKYPIQTIKPDKMKVRSFSSRKPIKKPLTSTPKLSLNNYSPKIEIFPD